MSVFIKKGDLLESDCTVIGHQANCFKTMGAGIAAQIKEKYHRAYLADLILPLDASDRLGLYSDAFESDKLIFNLYSQFRPGAVDEEWVDRGMQFELVLNRMLKTVKQCKVKIEKQYGSLKVGLPYMIGCGIAGGDWSEYYDIISEASNKYKVDIYLYRLA
jgi:O-acetyl-ADP-ribose deacetylase (regulator of RNase III)